MRRIREAWQRIASIARRDALESGLDEEIRFHLEQQTAKNVRAGMTPNQARRQALIKFGAAEPVKERTRDEFRAAILEDSARDLRYGARALRRSPVFTLVASITVALGIGAVTAVFSVVNGVLIKPLPYPSADALVDMAHVAPGVNIPGTIEMSAAQFFTYREQNRTFEHLGLWSRGSVTITGDGEPRELESLFVTHGTLQAVGVHPALGRWFSPEDDRPGTPETVILSYGYWQRQHSGDTSVIGRMVPVDAQPRRIIGVMPKDFRFLSGDADLIIPFRLDRSRAVLGQFNFQGLARLKPGVTLTEANTDVTRMIPIWLKGWPAPRGLNPELFESAMFAPALRPLKQAVVGDIGEVLWLLMGTIGIVLLIACTNVANLLLVRAEGRQQELAIRAALGAGWGRIARELLLESVVLGMSGGVLGLVIAWGGIKLLVAIGPATLPRLDEIEIDQTILVFTLGASLLSALLIGLAPVLRHARAHISQALRGGDRASSDSRQRHRARNALVIVQVALAMILLVGSGLMIRTFMALRDVRPGFTDPDDVQMVRISIPGAQVASAEQVFRMQNDIHDRVAAVSGVLAVSFTNSAPMEPNNSHDVVFAEHVAYPEGKIPPVRRFKFVAPGFFATSGIPIVAGRDLTWTDSSDRRPVAVISENLARELWKEPMAAIGGRIRENPAGPWREVVGVVGDVYDSGVNEPAPKIVYWPAMMANFWRNQIQVMRTVTFVIRSDRTGTESFLSELRGAVWAVNGNLPVAQVRTLGDLYRRSLARTSFTLVMLAIAAAMALLLGIVGIYGVIAYAVTQRTREIGIRVALGAPQRHLRRMFVGHALSLTGAGIACGVLAAIAASRLMTSVLFNVSPLDPTTYAAVSIVLAVAAVIASYIPAHRATAVDPLEALRAD